MLSVLESLPTGLLDLEATELYRILSGSTLIHLTGRIDSPLFVSVLLHGNEVTSWVALRKLLIKYQSQELPRSLSIFIGNVQAARYGQRQLQDQPDYNRIWLRGDSPEQQMTQQVIEAMRSRRCFASVDIHNNTGRNPHYACVNRLDRQFLHLARLFNPTIVYFTTPNTVQSTAFADFCPSVTLECGQTGNLAGIEHAFNYLETCLNLADLPTTPLSEINLFHTVAITKVPQKFSFSFDGNDADIRFPSDLDRLNFCELPIDTALCLVNPESNANLEAWDEQGQNVADRFFRIADGKILTTTPVMPSMLTLNAEIIRQDCLCYLMERLQAPD